MILEATDEHYAGLLAGQVPDGLRLPDCPIESDEILEFLRDLANSIRPSFAPASWLIVEDSEIVGLCSVIKPPTGDTIEIGYGIAACRRGRGAAGRAVGDLLEWARGDERVRYVRAENAIGNPASQAVLERNGFERTGRRLDPEDGEVICWLAAAGEESRG